MTEPTGYVLTQAVDAPPLMHLDPTEETQCGGRTWNPDDPTIEGSDISYEQLDPATANAMLDSGQALPCQRCGLKDHPTTKVVGYGETEGVG